MAGVHVPPGAVKSSKCSTTPDKCPFTKEDARTRHFDTEKDANDWIEARDKAENEAFTSFKKNRRIEADPNLRYNPTRKMWEGGKSFIVTTFGTFPDSETTVVTAYSRAGAVEEYGEKSRIVEASSNKQVFKVFEKNANDMINSRKNLKDLPLERKNILSKLQIAYQANNWLNGTSELYEDVEVCKEQAKILIDNKLSKDKDITRLTKKLLKYGKEYENQKNTRGTYSEERNLYICNKLFENGDIV